ncbi:MAG: response regulator [Anaerolineae bacterium]|nr:response regulator [Anaerolineae bacterium]
MSVDPEGFNLADYTIVIVEDDPNSYRATMSLLKMAGAQEVHARTNVSEAMALAKKLPKVDLFLVDIYMPGETGFDLLKRIRAHPQLKDSKVVALTASVMFADIRRIKAAGFDSFIGKPTRPGRFPDQIRAILAGEELWEWR